MTADEMQALARGMNFAETAFVTSPANPNAAFGLRCFTPTTEVAFSGHQLLGAAFVLAELGRLPGPGSEVYAEVGGELHSVVLGHPRDGGQGVAILERAAEFAPPIADISGVTAALSLDAMAIIHTGLPVQVVETGLACLIVPVRTMADLRAIMPAEQRLHGLLTESAASCLLAFTQETLSPANDVHVRVFAPPLGITEDPATGTANAALAAYLIRHGVWLGRPVLRVRSEQGSEVGRPSVIEMTVDASSEPTTVLVGGRVAKSVEGTVFY
jgi:trans-2,3-dihydro-3-hydroxyanthranilate isomerase